MAYILIFLIHAVQMTTCSDEWTLTREEENMKVFTQQMESGFEAVRIEAIIKTDLSNFVHFINNADNYQNWVYACSYSQTLSKDKNVLEYETVTDMPFPLQDRYLKIRSSQSFVGQSWIATSVAIRSESKPPYIVINDFKSNWIVDQIDGQTIHIQYEVRTIPGGYIPAWVYNLAVDIGPYNTLKSMKAFLENTNAKI